MFVVNRPLHVVFRSCAFLVACLIGAQSARAVEFEAPVVSRVDLELRIGEETIDVIHRGDLLTVLKEDGDNVLILTFNGKRGLVDKVNVANLAESVEVYDELLKEFPSEARYYTLRASAWWARGDEIAALGDYDMAIEKGYKEAHAYSSRGMFHAAIGNYDKAISDYTTAIEIDPADESFHINRAAVYMSQNRFDDAINDYNSALEIAPEKASSLQQRAVARKLAGRLQEAVADFTEALKVDPNHVPALMGRGFLHYQSGRHEKAIEDFSAVISLNPKAADAWNNRGYNRQQSGDFAKALADYDEALKLAPEYVLALTNKSWLLSTCPDEKIRHGKHAIEAATKACELTEFKDIGGLKALAAAFAEDGQFEKAIGWQEKAVELAPDAQKDGELKLLEQYRDQKPMRLADNG